MTTHSSYPSILEAVEVLSAIAESDLGREGIPPHESESYPTTLGWREEDPSATLAAVREIFGVILHHLKQFYKRERGHVEEQATLEGISTVMVLVGEAARKLDKYTEVFHHTQSVTEFKEYQQLQDFYRHKLMRQIRQRTSAKRTAKRHANRGGNALPFKAAPTKTDRLTDTKRVFVDLESVKRDANYELFFIRKEDGSRFFSPSFLRNMQLLCDFNSYFGEHRAADPLAEVKEWRDRVCHANARLLLKSVAAQADSFFAQLKKSVRRPLAAALSKALVALMLAAHPQNLLKNRPAKSCGRYFRDFQHFIREAMQTEEYQKWLVYAPSAQNKWAVELMELVDLVSFSFYTQLKGIEELKPLVQGLIQEAAPSAAEMDSQEERPSRPLTDRLAGDYSALSKQIDRGHLNGPLFKTLDLLDEGGVHAFDNAMHDNLPNPLYDLYTPKKRVAFLRLPAPIYQEFINKAVVNDEFKGFLRAYGRRVPPQRHLLINLQNRTSWRGHVRCLALEELQRLPEMERALSVVTLAMDTDFYHQLDPYHQVNQAELFKEQFKELLLDPHAGHFFPDALDRNALASFIDAALETIHRLFFSSKNVLSRERRLDFIEIFYLLLELKLIEWLEPDSVSLTCKDAIDTGEMSSVQLFVFLKWLSGTPWSEADAEHLNFMVYAPALLVRERTPLAGRFNRMLSALRAIENSRHEFGENQFAAILQEALSRMFEGTLLEAQLLRR